MLQQCTLQPIESKFKIHSIVSPVYCQLSKVLIFTHGDEKSPSSITWPRPVAS